MDLTQLLQQTLTPQAISAISNQIGAQPQQVQSGISAALPALLGGLSHNARTPQGAQGLNQALEQDHDGGLLDTLMGALGGGGAGGGMASALGGGGIASVLGGLMGGGGASQGGGGMMGALGGLLGGGGPSRATNGAGILGHIFGGQQNEVEDGVSRASGMSRAQTMQLLVMLAPLLMSAIGKMKRQKNLDAQGVAQALEQEEERATAPVPGMQKGGLTGMFDRNGNGSIADELAKIGAVAGGAYIFAQSQKRA